MNPSTWNCLLAYSTAVVATTVGTAKADMSAHHALTGHGERRVESAKMVRLTSTGLLPVLVGAYLGAHTLWVVTCSERLLRQAANVRR